MKTWVHILTACAALTLGAPVGLKAAATQSDTLAVQPASAWTLQNPANPRISPLMDTITPAGPGVQSQAVGTTFDTCQTAYAERRFLLPGLRGTAGATLSAHFDCSAPADYSATSFTVLLFLAGQEVGQRSYGIPAPVQGVPLHESVVPGSLALDLNDIAAYATFDAVGIRLNHYVCVGTNTIMLSDLRLATDPAEALTASERIVRLAAQADALPNRIGQRKWMARTLREAAAACATAEDAAAEGRVDDAYAAFDLTTDKLNAFITVLDRQDGKQTCKTGKKKCHAKAKRQEARDAIAALRAETESALEAVARERAQVTQVLAGDALDDARAAAEAKVTATQPLEEQGWRLEAIAGAFAKAELYIQQLGTDEARQALIIKAAAIEFDYYATAWTPSFDIGFHNPGDFLNDPNTQGGMPVGFPFRVDWDTAEAPAADIRVEAAAGTWTAAIDYIHFDDFGPLLEGWILADGPAEGGDLALVTLTVTGVDGRRMARGVLVVLP